MEGQRKAKNDFEQTHKETNFAQTRWQVTNQPKFSLSMFNFYNSRLLHFIILIFAAISDFREQTWRKLVKRSQRRNNEMS